VISVPACAQGVERGVQQTRPRAAQQNVAAGHGNGHGIGAGLDPVGHHLMMGAVQAVDALNADHRCARALDLRAHGGQAGGKIGHFRLAGGIDDFRLALRKRRRHHDGVGRADGHLRKLHPVALQATGRLDDHIAALDLDIRAELRQPFDEEVDRAGADGAAAGQRHAGLVHARDQWADDPEARPHLGDKFIRRGGVDDLAGGQVDRLAVQVVLARALAVDRIIDAVVHQDLRQLGNIAQARHIGKRQRVLGEQGGDHQRQGGILRPRNRDHALELPAPDDLDAVHIPTPTIKRAILKVSRKRPENSLTNLKAMPSSIR
jgi:hypothetical protein